MKITCDRDVLAAAFQLAAGVAPSRSPKEILTNVKLTVVGDTATLTATDLEVGICLEVREGLTVEREGTALLPVSRTGAILRESADETLTLEADESGIRIRGSRSRFQLPSASPEEFPAVTGFDASAYHTIPARLFRDLVRRTVFATDTESVRYALGGVMIEMEGDRVTAVGTDGRRLARMEGKGVAVGGHCTSGTNTIIPARAIQLMERAVGDKEETIDVAARLNDVLLRTPRCTIYSRLVEGRYPNWRQVIPQRERASHIDLTVGPLLVALRQAAIVTEKESRGINLTFAPGVLRIEAHTAEIGESHIELPIEYSEGTVKMTLDHRYVADFCKVLDSEREVIVEIDTANSPAVFTTDDGYVYVVMPMASE